jgi:hypothetical protein
VHADGEVWMGAAWKIRTHLNTTNGNAAGDAIANSLFLGWMNATTSAIHSSSRRSGSRSTTTTATSTTGRRTTSTSTRLPRPGLPGFTLPTISITGVTDLPDTSND